MPRYVEAVMAGRLELSGSAQATTVALGRQSEALSKLLFMPAALGTLVFGVLMVATELGVDHGDVDTQLAKVLRLNAIDVGILAVAIWAMVAKPML